MKQTRQGVYITLVKYIVGGKRTIVTQIQMNIPINKGIFLLKLTFPRTPFTPTKLESYHYDHAKAASTSWSCEKYMEIQ